MGRHLEGNRLRCQKVNRGEIEMPKQQEISPARRAYEAKRAAKAGKSLDAWLSEKEKKQSEAVKATLPPPPPKKPGLIARLLDRAHKPL
jgi:hypothetical protein